MDQVVGLLSAKAYYSLGIGLWKISSSVPMIFPKRLHEGIYHKSADFIELKPNLRSSKAFV